MVRSEHTLESFYDGVKLSMEVHEPEKEFKAIVQISHGMAEHKERYRGRFVYGFAADKINVSESAAIFIQS